MHLNIIYILLASTLMLCCCVSIDTQAQRGKKSGSFYKGRYKQIKISRIKAAVVCPIFEDSAYPYQGIGVKLGDPFALTYKLYPNKHWAFAIDAGKAASGLYSEHHRENFGGNTQVDTLNQQQGISYISHTVNSEWVIEAKLLLQKDAENLTKGLQLYAGLGFQYRMLDIDYEYLLEINFTDNEIGKINVTDETMGPTAVVGFEYAYFDLPISAFLELEGYYDIASNPGWLRFQGGVGLRYVF